MKFEFIDITTADVAFLAYGKDLNELFANAALAMFDVMVETSGVEPKDVKEVEATGVDLNSLMFNWLNELLIFVDSEDMVFSRFDVNVDEKNISLCAKCLGEHLSGKHKKGTAVKAATYHKMKIEKMGENLWKAQVILDI